MKQGFQILKDSFLQDTSFIRFHFRRNLYLYLDQDLISGDITIFLYHKGSNDHCGKLRMNCRGRIKESYLLSSKDLEHLIPRMHDLKKRGKHESMTISREEFLEMYC